MHVQAFAKGAQQGFVAADVGHDAQFDLAVVGAGDLAAGRGYEGFAHAPAFGRADGDVLQVGVIAGQAAGDGHGLGVVGVHAPAGGQGQLGQFVGVGALELGQSAVLQDLGRQGKVFGQFFQHFLVRAGGAGGRFLDHRQAQFDEKYFPDLLRTSEVEGLAGKVLRILLQLQDALAQGVALRRQRRGVDEHAVAFDAKEGFAAGDFERVDGTQARVLGQTRPEHAVHVERHVGIFAGVVRGLGDVDLVEGDLVCALAAQVFKAGATAPQVALGQAGQAVRLVHFEHVALQHGVVLVAAHLDTVVGEDVAVVLDVLPQLGALGVFEPGLQARQHGVARQLRGGIGVVVRQRDVGRHAGMHAQGEADDARPHGVQ